MINLLPVEEKKKIATDFHVRTAIVYLYALSICMGVLTIVLLPSFFFSLTKERLAEAKWENLQSLPVPELDKETTAIIKEVNTKLSIIDNSEKAKFSVLERVVNEVIDQKMPDIKINMFNYYKDKDGNKVVELNGIAKNRERLLLFRQTLEQDKLFSKVDLPISNFIKGEDINFSLSLVAS